MIIQILTLIGAYLIGSLPTGYWLAKFFFEVDIRQYGSGNIGATNIGRILGKKYFLIVMLIDVLKAYATLAAASLYVSNELWYLFCVAGALLIGNAHSLFLHFRGGKGVATALGIISFFMPSWLVLSFACIWGLIFAITAFAFLASLIAMLFVLIAHIIFFGLTSLAFFLVIVFFWLVIRHLSNFASMNR
ncbi:glycerol-3-phosphate acyltransferase [Candidatus Dependentiae bacterium]|jgi:glycerol-3-phosphate acyltransferase PlsY|nr:glycerol-3-phosphate acyltransferase [Candidatus Dependentiae bacterium]